MRRSTDEHYALGRVSVTPRDYLPSLSVLRGCRKTRSTQSQTYVASGNSHCRKSGTSQELMRGRRLGTPLDIRHKGWVRIEMVYRFMSTICDNAYQSFGTPESVISITPLGSGILRMECIRWAFVALQSLIAHVATIFCRMPYNGTLYLAIHPLLTNTLISWHFDQRTQYAWKQRLPLHWTWRICLTAWDTCTRTQGLSHEQ